MQLPGVVVRGKVAVRLKIALDIRAWELWEKREQIHC